MGLISAALNSGMSTLRDQYLEFVTLENIDKDVLVKREYPRRNGDNKGNLNVISNGSRIVIPPGFAMLLIDNGRLEFSAEPGEYIYDTGSEPSLFYGKLGQNIKNSFLQWGKRIKFGGDEAKDTRVYYVNLRLIDGNKFGTGKPVPFDDPKYQTIYLRYFGQYSLQVANPIVLIENLIGGAAKDEVRIGEYISQLKAEFISSLTTAMSRLAYEKNISFNRLPMFQDELGQYMNDAKDDSWLETRGIQVVTVGIESIDADEKSQERIQEYDKMYFGEAHGRGMLTEATAQAMKDAAKNEGGMPGMFMGMGLGNMMGGMMGAGAQMGMNQQPSIQGATMQYPQQPQPTQQFQQPDAQPQNVQQFTPNTPTQNTSNQWTCECGQENTNNFCMNCGKPKPQPKPEPTTWKCQCGQENSGNFCMNCGSAKPQIPSEWVCSCGTTNKGNFCMNCGKPKQ